MEVVNQNNNSPTHCSDGFNNNINLSNSPNGNGEGGLCADSNKTQTSRVREQFGFSYRNNNTSFLTLEEVPENVSGEETTEVAESAVKISNPRQLVDVVERGEGIVAAAPDRVEDFEADERTVEGKRPEEEEEEDVKKREDTLLAADQSSTESLKAAAAASSNKSSSNSNNNHHHQQHRVKFTEELPSQSGNYKRMTTSTSTAATTMTAVAVNHQQQGEVSASADPSPQPLPQITISEEDFPPREDWAIGTKMNSSYEGWDNPFRPEGEISHDAEELLRLWKEGRLPYGAEASGGRDGSSDNEQHSEKESNSPPQLNGRNGHKNGSSSFEVKGETAAGIPAATNPRTVVLENKTSLKKKTKEEGCCSLM